MNVSLVELLQGARTPSPTLTKEEAGQAAVQAMEQSQKNTARRYLRLFRRLLTAGAVLCFLLLLPHLTVGAFYLYFRYLRAPGLGVIGGSDGPTVIITSNPSPLPPWVPLVCLGAVFLTCIILALRVRRIERRLK